VDELDVHPDGGVHRGKGRHVANGAERTGGNGSAGAQVGSLIANDVSKVPSTLPATTWNCAAVETPGSNRNGRARRGTTVTRLSGMGSGALTREDTES
jgi:hypothetical protein